MVLSALITSTELSIGHEQIDVVASHKILGQVHDRHHQTLFAVVVAGLFGDVSDELSHLVAQGQVEPSKVRTYKQTLISLLSFRLKQPQMTFL